MAEKILVPLDGTELAEQVIPFIAEFAKFGGFHVSLLTVTDPKDLDITETAGEGVPEAHDQGTGPGRGMDMAGSGTGGVTGLVWMAEIGSPADLSAAEAKALDEANRSTQEYLFSIEKKLEAQGVRTDVVLGFGNPDREIADEAIRAGASMIAMAARTGRFWERGVLGTTTDRVINSSPMPVIVFKPLKGLADAVSVAPKKLVIALDGSEETERCIAHAVKLAGALGASVALVHVLNRDSGRRRERAEEYLAAVAGRIDGVVETRVVTGSIDDEIIFFADQFDDPMIVVGEHGGVSIGRWLRGSSTDKVIRNSGYPVMVVPNGG